MDLVDLDLCVVLPVSALEAWVRADPAERMEWLSGDATVEEVAVGDDSGFVFRREKPRPYKAVVVAEPRRRVHVVVSGASDASVQQAIDEPDVALLLSSDLRLKSGLMIMGADLAHADIGGGTPVAGPHRMVDLAPGRFRVELRSVGEADEPGFAMVIAFEPA